MKIRFETAKNAHVTCSVNGRFLHSKYNPENEAKNFVDSVECNYNPTCVIVTGSALPYCVPFFKERFPSIPLFAIQYNDIFCKNSVDTKGLENVHNEWTQTFLCEESISAEQLSENMYSVMGEMILSAPLVVSWKAGDEAFVKESTIAWDALKILLQKSRDVLATRSYFSLRWLKNCISFCVRSKNLAAPQKQDLPILLVASGPSLQQSLTKIKDIQSSCIILALSSALPTLIHHGIIPDICISTDGGYYAKKHLDILVALYKKGYSIPLAVSLESNVPSEVLEVATLIPLTYRDGIETDLLQALNIQSYPVERNGSVSGTAALFALSLTSNNVYAFGLDLSVGKSFSHANPNAHEVINSLSDFRLHPLAYRLYKNEYAQSSKNSSALDLYRQWFETRDTTFASRFYRVFADDCVNTNVLGIIKDIPYSKFLELASIDNSKKAKVSMINPLILAPNRKENLKKFIIAERNNTSSKWIEHCALSELLALQKYPHSIEYKKKMDERLEMCFDTIERMCL